MIEALTQQEVQLPAGTIRYREVGDGPPLLFVHGFLVDSRLWDGVVAELAGSYRCIVPDWPFASHRVAMNPDADLTPYGIADLIASFLDALGLERATLVGNDSGGSMSQVLAGRHPDRVERLILTNTDTHERLPPGPFKLLPPLARIPGAMAVLTAPMRVGPIARAAFRPFTRDPLPAGLVESWLEPARRDPAILRDTRKFLLDMKNRYTLEAAERLSRSDIPLLLVWATADWTFPIRYAERLAAEVPNSHLVRIGEGAKTFVPIDEPQRVAAAIDEWLRKTP